MCFFLGFSWLFSVSFVSVRWVLVQGRYNSENNSCWFFGFCCSIVGFVVSMVDLEEYTTSTESIQVEVFTRKRIKKLNLVVFELNFIYLWNLSARILVRVHTLFPTFVNASMRALSCSSMSGCSLACCANFCSESSSFSSIALIFSSCSCCCGAECLIGRGV